ncbi:GrpB family protein [Paenibacillus sp. 481]|uniref:GrpB family protein n=1 Tax=Paenibacillus sp. 481 TaxID=2835869 RepID=UPI001E5570E0|nr:GrpB family protein [Paenibacillus sp. 481]UHA72756.1 GrpB family protein [Paenibacillus sp. 481]
MEIVTLREYDPIWQDEFARDKALITTCLPDLLLGVEHIGSTSVPGLVAKPVIDIMIGVADLAHIGAESIQALAQIGYEYVPKSDFPTRMFFRRGQWRAGTHHLHVYTHNSEEWVSNLRFRDYLRSHVEAQHAYAELKKQLASQFMHDRVSYTKGKAAFIKAIIEQAKRKLVVDVTK